MKPANLWPIAAGIITGLILWFITASTAAANAATNADIDFEARFFLFGQGCGSTDPAIVYVYRLHRRVYPNSWGRSASYAIHGICGRIPFGGTTTIGRQ